MTWKTFFILCSRKIFKVAPRGRTKLKWLTLIQYVSQERVTILTDVCMISLISVAPNDSICVGVLDRQLECWPHKRPPQICQRVRIKRKRAHTRNCLKTSTRHNAAARCAAGCDVFAPCAITTFVIDHISTFCPLLAIGPKYAACWTTCTDTREPRLDRPLADDNRICRTRRRRAREGGRPP